jgi:membrane fusion protein, heavy metal efflux system
MTKLRLTAAFAALALAAAGCQAPASPEAHDDGHHAAHGAEAVVITHFTPQSEVFVEFPPFAAGARSPFALHVTELPSGRAIGDGRVVVRLVSPQGEERWEAEPSATPGIFRPAPIPARAGEHRLFIDIVRPSGTITHELGPIMVFATAAEADASLAEAPAGPEGVSFLKEQQWRVDFASAVAEAKPVSASIPARVLIRGAGDGEAAVAAPVSGRIEATGGFPTIGQRVRQGQTLFRIRPLGGEAAEAAGVAAERARAAAEAEAARADLARVEGLLARGAVSQRRLEEAQARLAAAEGALNAGNAGLASLGGTVRAPISGVIASLSVRPGDTANAGAVIARVVNPNRLYIEARVAERDAGALRDPAGVVIEPSGGDAISLTGDSVRVLGAGGAIDPQTRTVSVAFESRGRDGLMIGMVAPGRVFVGAPRQTVTIPRAAVVDDGGLSVVYVLLDGETFERRIVQLGAAVGDRIAVASGVSAGERVVSRGAYLVRLAEAGPAEAGHGHAH